MSKMERMALVGRTHGSYSFVDYIRSREIGLKERRTVFAEYLPRHIISHGLLKEYRIPLTNVDKVFCSQWLSDREIVFGTKCNKLMVYDVTTMKLNQISLLGQQAAQEQLGIYATQLNPSRTLLATRAKNGHEVAVYRSPTMDPLCVGENAHKDWVFDVCWLDDQFLVSGSSYCNLALWKVVDDDVVVDTPQYAYINPVKLSKGGHKMQALVFNPACQEIATLCLNGFIQFWNAEIFQQTNFRKLPSGSGQEYFCIAVRESGLYSIGCRGYTLLVDLRTSHPVAKISTKSKICDVLNASFQGNILTIGTSFPKLMFYDLRALKNLEFSINSRLPVELESFRYAIEDEGFPAIYTHSYDMTGTRIFAAGGPLPPNTDGNYAAIWQ